jgi:CarD family transcriptional regulator
MQSRIGDKIVHPRHGTGIVRRRCSVTWNGTPHEVCAIEFTATRMEIYVPVAEVDGLALRPMATAEELKTLSSILACPPQPLPRQRTARHAMLDARLRTTEVSHLAEIVRDLAAFRQTHSRDYYWKDRETYDQARKILSAEWALAASISVDEAETEIGQALNGHDAQPDATGAPQRKSE